MQGEYTGPNLKALLRIMAALFTAAALCFAICITLITRPKPPRHHSVHTATPARCICGGQCASQRAR